MSNQSLPQSYASFASYAFGENPFVCGKNPPKIPGNPIVWKNLIRCLESVLHPSNAGNKKYVTVTTNSLRKALAWGTEEYMREEATYG